MYVWQLNCLVMFILDFGPLMLTLVQMKGHVLHFSWLQGVVPGVLVAGCRSFDGTNMSWILVSRLYAISGGWLKILATSVHACRRLQFDWMIYARGQWRGGKGDS